MPDLLERRKRELICQFGELSAELVRWKELSKPGGAYEKHHSQIDALSQQMLALNARVIKEWEDSKADPFDALLRARMRCAAVHTVWNFFREKLVLRLDPSFGGYLKAADAYAWACYEPVLLDRKRGDTTRQYREPPLVTFNSDVSPWALSRQSRYNVEPDETGANREETFRRVYEALPIPIVGIPWQSAGFLPGLATLAHETGHVVDSDFGLKAGLSAAIAKAVDTSRLADGWSTNWRKEVFADLFACWVAGPSFVWALADALPESPAVVATRKKPSGAGPDSWGRYPPATLRILLNTCALRELGFAAEAKTIADYWTGDYPTHAMSDCEGDLQPVVRAVYEAARLPKSLRYSQLASQEARAIRSAFERDEDLPDDQVLDPRALVGAASAANRRPTDGALLARGYERLANYIAKSRPPGQLDRQEQRAGAFSSSKTEELFHLLLDSLGDGEP